MSIEKGLNPALLKNAKTDASGNITAACPACREQGHDKKGDHLLITADGRFGCCANAGDHEHRKRIFALVGTAQTPQDRAKPFTDTKPPAQSWATLAAAAQACTPKNFMLVKTWLYADGEIPVGGVARYEHPHNEKTFRQFKAIGGAWQLGGPDRKWPLLGYDTVPSSGPVIVLEGEKARDCASALGLPAVCAAGGSGAAGKTDWAPLAGRVVWILPDHDEAGERFASSVKSILHTLDSKTQTRIVRLPDLPDGGDIVEWVEAQKDLTPAELCDEIELLVESSPVEDVDAVGGAVSSKIPPIVAAQDFMAERIPEPPQVIKTLMRGGQVGLMASMSKGGKTWAMQSLGLAVPNGLTWLGWETTPGRVLYVDPELQPYDGQSRLAYLADSMGLDGVPAGLDLWRVKGVTLGIRDMIPLILRRQEQVGKPYSLILLDSLYYLNGGRDENDNTEQSKTMAELYTLTAQTGAAVLVSHHFSKGNKSGTDHLDRASGAGVFARAPDVFMTLTPHQEHDCYTVEATCRSFAKPEPFVARWEFPLWRRADELDPEALKRPMLSGRSVQFTPKQIIELLPPDGLTHGDWKKKAEDELGCKSTTFNSLLKRVRESGLATCGFGRYLPGSSATKDEPQILSAALREQLEKGA